jgi:hypothetical protein
VVGSRPWELTFSPSYINSFIPEDLSARLIHLMYTMLGSLGRANLNHPIMYSSDSGAYIDGQML